MKSIKPYIIPVFITHLGCPHQCVYCNQKTITGLSFPLKEKQTIDLEKIKREIDYFLNRKIHPKHKEIQIAFYGGSFTALKPSLRKKLLDLGYEYVRKGQVDALRLSTRPDAVDESILAELKAYGVKIIELGVQSLDDRVLRLSKRGHMATDVYKATEKIKQNGFLLGWQLMPGLPGETQDSLRQTVEGVLKWRPDFVRLYPTVVVKGTLLARWFREGKYRPLELYEAIEICKKMFICFEMNGIRVIRMGLQASESLLKPGQILAGPWHPAFGELVKSAVWLECLKVILTQNNFQAKELTIFSHPANLPQIVGHKKNNLEALKRLFPKKRIAFVPDLMLKKDKLKISDGRNWVCFSINSCLEDGRCLL